MKKINNSTKPIHVHFVCTGNAYRSRLAEAYAKSKNLKHITFSSSGTQATETYLFNGPICWYAMKLASRHGLISHIKPAAENTTKEKLETANLVIFMSQSHHDFVRQKLGFKGKHQIWHIPDLDQQGFSSNESEHQNILELIITTEKTFEEISSKINLLIDEMKTHQS